MHIDLFLPNSSQYEVLQSFTKEIYEAFLRGGVKARLLSLEDAAIVESIRLIRENPPNATFTFNAIPPFEDGRTPHDLLGVPNIFYLVDASPRFINLIQSPYSIITCVDRTGVDFLHLMNFEKTLFTPHAVDRSLGAPVDVVREYEVLMLGSFVDYQAMRLGWRKKNSKVIGTIMDETIECIEADSKLPYYKALSQVIGNHKEVKLDTAQFCQMLSSIENYIRGKVRIEMINNVSKIRKIDVCGAQDIDGGWKKYLKNVKNIKFHPQVTFEKALEMMKKSKIVLNNSSWIKYGAHERIFTGLACGALVVTDKNEYLSQYFKDGESIAFYQQWDELNDHLETYLTNVLERERVVHHGRNIVMEHHTWDHRVAEILKALPGLLR